MANEYTSIATAGIATQLVQTAYDTAVQYALRTMPTCRVAVTTRPISPAMRGSSTIMTKINWFGDASVTAAMTPLTEEADVDSTKLPAASTVTLTPAEYGFAVTHTKKITSRSFTEIDPIKAQLIADHMNRTIDKLVQSTLDDASYVYYGGDATQNSELAAGDELTASMLRAVVTRLRGDGVQPFTGGYYLGLFHPRVVHDLREETGSGSWRFPAEYANSMDLKTGEIGEFEGVRFLQNPQLNWAKDGSGSGDTQLRSINGYVLGANGLAEQVVEEPHVVVGPVIDKLGRFQTLGWYGDIDWAIYEEKAIRHFVTVSSLNDDLD